MKHPEKKTCYGEGMAGLVTHQDSVLVCSGLWLLVRVSQLASDFSLVQAVFCCKWSQDSWLYICIRSLRCGACACCHTKGSCLS